MERKRSGEESQSMNVQRMLMHGLFAPLLTSPKRTFAASIMHNHGQSVGTVSPAKSREQLLLNWTTDHFVKQGQEAK